MANRIRVSILLFTLAMTQAFADVPASVPVQGRLTDSQGKPVADGVYNVRLSLCNGPAGPQSATDTITFNSNSIVLAHSPVVSNSETVKKSDNSVTYTRGVAYTVDYPSGTITRVSAAMIPDGTSVTISYQWTASSLASTTRTVQTLSGIFASSMDIWPYNLTGNDWVQVEVDHGGVFEALLPRIRLQSVPYALKTYTIDGAEGGAISGGISVNGAVSASGSVSGTGSSRMIVKFPFVIPGLQGNGATSTAGEAPGVLAVGANNGAGTALRTQGKADIAGDLSVSGAANVTGQVNSGSVQTGVIYGAGLTTTGSLPSIQALHTEKDIATGNIYGHGEISVTGNISGDVLSGTSGYLYGGLTAASVTLSGKMTADSAAVTNGLTTGSATVAGALTADNMSVRYASLGDVSCTGIVAGTGGLAPDYTALGHVYQDAGHYSQFFTLPTYMSSDPSLLFIDVMEYSDASGPRYYLSPQHLNWNTTTTGSLNVSLSSTNPGTGNVYFRVRVWKCRPQ